MIALALMITLTAFFALGRLVGRQDAQKAMLLYLAGMYKRLPIEDKLLFDKWVREYKEFLERK